MEFEDAHYCQVEDMIFDGRIAMAETDWLRCADESNKNMAIDKDRIIFIKEESGGGTSVVLDDGGLVTAIQPFEVIWDRLKE